MNFEGELFKLGVGTWVMDVITQIPNPASTQFNIGQTLPKNVGYIYGLSTYCDGVDTQNVALPTTAQLQALYLTFKNGPAEFFSMVRMSDFSNELLNATSNSYQVRDQKYTPVNIPAFDLSTSFYNNPTSIVGPINIRLKLWYVQLGDWNDIKEKMMMKHHKESMDLHGDTKLKSFIHQHNQGKK